MIKNEKLVKSLKTIEIGLVIFIALSLLIHLLKPNLEFPKEILNRFSGFFIAYLWIVTFIINILILQHFSTIIKWITMLLGIPITFFSIFMILGMYEKIGYEPHTDRYKVYQNINNKNQYVIGQDFIEWKPNKPSVDTTLINDYFFVREIKYLNSMTVKGKWLKLDSSGKIIDTVIFK